MQQFWATTKRINNRLTRDEGALRRILLIVAFVCGATVAVLPPAGYYYVTHLSEKEELEHETEAAAARLAGLAALKVLWSADKSVIEKIAVTTEVSARNYGTTVRDQNGRAIFEANNKDGLIVFRETVPISSDGMQIGSLEFTHVHDDHFWITVWLALASIALGCCVWGVVYYLPIKALDRTLLSLRSAHTLVQHHLEVVTQSNEALKGRELELVQGNLELERAHSLARSSSRAKSEFLANMSHELRTPP